MKKLNLKKILTAIVAVTVLAAMSVTALAASVVTATGSANVRSSASLDGYVLCQVKKGSTFVYAGSTKTDERGVDWYKIKVNGRTGWISENVAKKTKAPSNAKTGGKTADTIKKNLIIADKGSANLRDEPSLWGDVIGGMPKGTTATFLNASKKDERGVRWFKVRVNGRVGWVSSRYTSRGKL